MNYGHFSDDGRELEGNIIPPHDDGEVYEVRVTAKLKAGPEHREGSAAPA